MENDLASLNLVTLNCLGIPFVNNTRTRLTTIAREMETRAADIVCLQEVQYAAYVPFLDQVFASFPFKAYEPFVYAPKGGLLTFARHQIAAQTFVLYDERGWWHTPSLADRLLHKGILTSRLQLAEQQVVILNTHLTANYSGDWSRSNRYARLEHRQLRQLAAVVNGVNADSLVIIAGDFNIPRHSWLYEDFVALTGVIDPLNGQLEPTFFPALNLPERYSQPIDHVLIRPPAGHTLHAQAEILFQEAVYLTSGGVGRLSDHAALQLRLQW